MLLSSDDRFSMGNSHLQSSVGSRAFQNARLQKQFKKQAEVLLPAAAAAYRQGKHADAQALCRQILKDLPEHFDALHLLGVSELDCRQFGEAERTLARAVSVTPRSAEAHSNLGLALFNLKRYDDARKCQERAVALKPNFPTAWTSLGNALMRLELAEQAVAAHDRAIQLKPDYVDAYCNRGMALLLLNRVAEADQSFDRALAFQRGHLQAMLGKGIASLRLRHCDAAQAAFNAVLAIKPNLAEVLAYRGRAHQQMGQILARRKPILTRRSRLIRPWRARGGARPELKSFWVTTRRRLAACMKALEQDPASVIAITLLGTCYAQQGDIATAIEHYDRALAIAPDYEEALVKKIFALDFAPDADFAIHQAARRAWWDTIGVKVPRRELQRSMPDPNKRIVVGYVSSDFRFHSAALAFRPVLRHHDRRAFEVICYSCSPLHDEVTEECKSLVDRWVDAWQFSDDELADRIQADGVDILVDLSGHTAGNRLTVFARKPAPIQVTAWGAGTGTGLQTMDYFFADPVTVPEAARPLFAEKVYDLPCVITTEALPDVQPSPLPMIRNGHVTFGVFNRIDKISDGALACGRSSCGQSQDPPSSSRTPPISFCATALIGRFVAHGVSPDRIRCIGTTSRPEHLAEFAEHRHFARSVSAKWRRQHLGIAAGGRSGRHQARRQCAVPPRRRHRESGRPRRLGGRGRGRLPLQSRGHTPRWPRTCEALRAALPARVAASAAGNGEIYTRRVEQGYRQFWRDYCAALS